MNVVFHGPAKACWIMGLLLILVSAVESLLTGGNRLFPFLVLGFVSIGCAYFLRSRESRG